MAHFTQLSVNVNKLATLRNSRGKNNPDVLQWTIDLIAYGAQGITVHPRPDGRHIRQQDVLALADLFSQAQYSHIEFNIEGYPDENFLALVKSVKPTQCTLVPDPPDVLTSNAGWKIEENIIFLEQVIQDLKAHEIRSALFIDPNGFTEREAECLLKTGTDRIELYTEAYAEHYGTPLSETILALYQNTAEKVHGMGVGINAGHDLNLDNLQNFIQHIPMTKEVSIGHALICDALRYGMKETVRRYLACLKS